MQDVHHHLTWSLVYMKLPFLSYIFLFVLNKKLSMNWYVCFLKPPFGLSWFVNILIESKEFLFRCIYM